MIGKSAVIRLLARIPCEIWKTLRYIELKSAQVPSNGVWTNPLAMKMAIGHRVLWKKCKSAPESSGKAWISWRHHAAVTVLLAVFVSHRLSPVVWRVEIEENLVWNGNVILVLRCSLLGWIIINAMSLLNWTFGFILLGCHLEGCRRIL